VLRPDDLVRHPEAGRGLPAESNFRAESHVIE